MHFLKNKVTGFVVTLALLFLLLSVALPFDAFSLSRAQPPCGPGDSVLPAPLLRFPLVEAARDSFLIRNPLLKAAFHKDSSGRVVDIFGRPVGC